MIDALEHPLVADYLRELDAALAGLPAAAAPAAAAGGGEGGRAPPLSRMVTWARRLPVKVRLAVAAIAIAIGLPSGALILWQAQTDLEFWTTSAWWSRVDGAHEVQTEAAGASQYTVPIRPGQVPGFVINGYHPSDMTQGIVGGRHPLPPRASLSPPI